MPRPIAHIYLRLSGRGDFHYERYLSYWGLPRLVREFEVVDYPRRIVEQLALFHAEYMIKPGTLEARIASVVLRFAYGFFPGYVWLLRKTS